MDVKMSVGDEIDKEAARRRFIREAIDLALFSVKQGGGPFGAVVVRDGEVIGRGHNRVATCNDPTAHAEIVAIRDACANIGSFRLDGCELFVNCMPCPMCQGAIYWSHIAAVYYASSAAEAADVGFLDAYIAGEMARPQEQRALPLVQLDDPAAPKVFEAWRALSDRVEY